MDAFLRAGFKKYHFKVSTGWEIPERREKLPHRHITEELLGSDNSLIDVINPEQRVFRTT